MIRRFLTVLGIAAALLLALAAPASAHVTVSPPSVAPGATDVQISIRVPTESDSATTTKVEVQLPSDTPLLGVMVKPKAGWTVKVTTKKLPKPLTTDDGTITEAASQITWSGGSIPSEEYDDFDFLVGAMPEDAEQIKFPTIQTYSDGKEVSWIEDTPAGGEEPENPTPVLELAKASSGSTTATTVAAGKKTTVVAVTGATKDDVDSAKTLAIVGIVIGIIGVALAIGALVMKRRTPGDSGGSASTT